MDDLSVVRDRVFDRIDTLVQRILLGEKLLLIPPRDIMGTKGKNDCRWYSSNPEKFEGHVSLSVMDDPYFDYTLRFEAGPYTLFLLRDGVTVTISKHYGRLAQVDMECFKLGDMEPDGLLTEKIRWLTLRAFENLEPRPRRSVEMSPEEKRGQARRVRIARRKERKRLRALCRQK